MSSLYIPLQQQIVEEKAVTQALMAFVPIQHDEQQYLAALHQKAENQNSLLERRPEYQNSIFNRLNQHEPSNAECRCCSNHLSWTSGKVLCRFCGCWVCNRCVSKERLDPQDPNIKARICHICQDTYLKNVVNHEFYTQEKILEAVFKRLVSEQFDLEKLIKEQIKRNNENDEKQATNKVMGKILAINKQKVENDSLKEDVEDLQLKIEKAEKIYKQLAIRCQSKKRIVTESRTSFVSEMSKVYLMDDEDDFLQPPTALPSFPIKSYAMRTQSPKTSFVGSILDQYDKAKPKESIQEELVDADDKRFCKCLLS